MGERTYHMNIYFIYTYTLWKVSVFGVILVHISRIWTECGEILHISLYSLQMRENTDQNNPKYGHFLCSDTFIYMYLCIYMYIYANHVNIYIPIYLSISILCIYIYHICMFRYVSRYIHIDIYNTYICIYRERYV